MYQQSNTADSPSLHRINMTSFCSEFVVHGVTGLTTRGQLKGEGVGVYKLNFYDLSTLRTKSYSCLTGNELVFMYLGINVSVPRSDALI